MSDAARQQISFLSQQRELLMASLEECQLVKSSDKSVNDAIVDRDALNFAVHTALSKAMTSKSSEDHSRYERTIEHLENRLASAEVNAPPRADAQGMA
jgi:hypothetical protein